MAFSTGLPILGIIPSFDAETKSKGPISEFNRLVNIIRGGGSRKEKKSNQMQTDLIVLKESKPRLEMAAHEPHNNAIELISSNKPQSMQSESYRSIRTSLFGSCPPDKIKSILFTSPLAREGKSTTVSNLGITLSKANMRVVIVDADLRKPSQNQIFNLNSGMSLNQYLDPNNGGLKGLFTPTPFKNLCVIKSEPLSGSPIELLTSERMKNLVMSLRNLFEYILFDTPPILAVSDALAIGSMADGVILIVRGEQTPIQAMKQAKQKLDAHKLNSLGVILNDVNLIEQYGYYAKEYYHYYSQDKK